MNNPAAPRPRIAAMAYAVSLLFAPIAPFAAMIADTPQMDEPTARSTIPILSHNS